jgi:hypothetical protein
MISRPRRNDRLDLCGRIICGSTWDAAIDADTSEAVVATEPVGGLVSA